MKYLNYDFVDNEHLHYLKSYKYKGTDQSLLYNYLLSPFAEFCLKFVPMNVAPNVLTLMGLTCIIVPHIAFYFVMGDNFGGFVPNWLLWFTAALHMLYMNFDNLDGKQARRTKNSSPLGMILDHNFDSMIILIQGTSLTTAMQFGNTIFAVLLYIIPTIPFYIIAHEEYYTHEMNLPIVNAAAEGTVSVAVIFAATAYFGCNMWLETTFLGLQTNYFVMLLFVGSLIVVLPSVFLKIKKFVSIGVVLKQLRYFFFFNTVIVYSIYFSPTNVIQNHVRAYMYTVGFTMSKSVGIVALNHVSNTDLPKYLNSIYIYVIILFNTLSGQILGKTLIDEGILIQSAATVSFLFHMHFLYNVGRQISQTLNIQIFKVNKIE